MWGSAPRPDLVDITSTRKKYFFDFVTIPRRFQQQRNDGERLPIEENFQASAGGFKKIPCKRGP
ncbi:MAG: hypothetical protein C5B49_16595 [Bdellovibrio sp.]|nr:MAG: hypothetical protein C5B49_16595 [Bdellovibrio sp.]